MNYDKMAEIFRICKQVGIRTRVERKINEFIAN